MKKKKLPIDDFWAQIISAVNSNPVTIITAETGAGKSTRVPQFLLDDGYSLVVTQPRRLAARSVAKRVAQERDCELGSEIGFRTAYEKQDGPNTRCLFVTDGLALVRELMGTHRHQILVLDEVHEWNLNMEVLVAWSKRQIESGVEFKLVIMSATLEAEKLSVYFNNAPVITVPGRCYPVEEKGSSGSIGHDISNLLKEGRNVLVFQPGKKEIGELWGQLESYGLNAEILPLHGELEADEQDRVFRSYSRPKCVIATNVAQTSITIEDIDAVVDGGTERRIELNEGVEGLFLKAISLADRAQRKGRAGRCREGIYIDCCPTEDKYRLDFPQAEILRVRLDQTVLRLAEAKIDAEGLDFFHQPPQDQIHEAKRALRALGCMDENGNVSVTGRKVSRLPISVQYGRMIVEAEKLGVVDDIIDVAAILEQGGITARKVIGPDGYKADGNEIARQKFCPDEQESNVLAQLAIFRGAKEMTNDERRASGVFVKAYHQAVDRRRLLADALKSKVRFSKGSGKRENILRAICAGMVDHLYRNVDYNSWRNGDDMDRSQSKDEIRLYSDWLVGLPFDLEIEGRRGRFTINLVTMTTKVDPTMLIEIAPQLSRVIEGVNPQYNSEKDMCVSTRQTFFNDMLVKEEVVETPEHSQASEVLAAWLANQSYYGYDIAGYDFVADNVLISRRAGALNTRAGERIFVYPNSRSEWQEFVSGKIGSARCLAEIKKEDFLFAGIDAELEAKVLADNPESLLIGDENIPVIYTDDWAGINITEQLAKKCAGSVALPSGRPVRLISNGYNHFGNWAEANAYFENKRIEKAWQAKKNEMQNNLWLESEEDFAGLLDKLAPQEYAERDNGEKVYAFPCISLSGNSFCLTVRDDADSAASANIQAVRSFLRLTLEKETRPVYEAPWYGWVWTASGNKFMKEGESIISHIVEQVDVENFSSSLNAARQSLRDLKESLFSDDNRIGKLIENMENDFHNRFSGQSLELIREESQQFFDLVSEARRLRDDTDLPGAEEKIDEAKALFAGLVDLEERRKAERKARDNNDTVRSRRESWQDKVGTSNDAMAEALRRAGLID